MAAVARSSLLKDLGESRFVSKKGKDHGFVLCVIVYISPEWTLHIIRDDFYQTNSIKELKDQVQNTTVKLKITNKMDA